MRDTPTRERKRATGRGPSAVRVADGRPGAAKPDVTPGGAPNPASLLQPTTERAVFVGLLVLAAVARFYDLGYKALHHDESLHAVYSWYITVGKGWKHDPFMHGPFQFHWMAFWQTLLSAQDAPLAFLGVSPDAAVRVGAAIAGIASVAACWWLRPVLGRYGALAAAVLLAFLPDQLYFTRFAREDAYTAFFTLAAAIGLVRFVGTRQVRWAYLCTVSLSFFFATKESVYLIGAAWAAFLGIRLVLEMDPRWFWSTGAQPTGGDGETPALERPSWQTAFGLGAVAGVLAAAATHLLLPVLKQPGADRVPLAVLSAVTGVSAVCVRYVSPPLVARVAALIRGPRAESRLFEAGKAVGWHWIGLMGVFPLITFPLFVSLFANNVFEVFPDFGAMWGRLNLAGLQTGFAGALVYWAEQQGVQRGSQPWFYYVLLLGTYDLPVVVLALMQGYRMVRHRRAYGFAEWFLFAWAVEAFALFTYAGERMPWLTIHMSLPLALLAALWLNRWLEETLPWRRPALLALAGGSLLAMGLLLLGPAPQQIHPLEPIVVPSPADTIANALHRVLAAVAFGVVIAGTGYGLWRAADQRRALKMLTTYGALGAACLFTLVATFRLSYVNPSRPVELAVYVQSSQDVVDTYRELQQAGEVSGQGTNLKVLIDTGLAWPMSWYLRDWDGKQYFDQRTFPAALDPATTPYVLIMKENLAVAEEKLNAAGYARTPGRLNWWYPEEYKQLSLGDLTQVGDWLKPVRYWLWRELPQPPLGSRDYYVYRSPLIGSALASQPRADEGLVTVQSVQRGVATLLAQNAPAGALRGARSIAVAPDGRVAIGDVENQRIILLKPDGTLDRAFGRKGATAGDLNEPWGLAFDTDGSLVVSDTFNHRLQRFDRDGKPLAQWGSGGVTQSATEQGGVFFGPRELAIASDGTMYVADTGNKRVQVLDRTGKFLRAFGGAGTAPGQFDEPTGLAMAPDGTLWIVDAYNNRVQHVDAQGQPLGSVAVAGLDDKGVTNKGQVVIGTDGTVFVAVPARAQLLAIRGDQAHPVTIPGVTLTRPVGLAVQGDNLFVVDADSGQIVRVKVSDLAQ